MGFFLQALWVLLGLSGFGMKEQFQSLSFPENGKETENFKAC